MPAAPDTPASAPAGSSALPAPTRGSGRPPWLWAAVALTVIAIAAIAVFFGVDRDGGTGTALQPSSGGPSTSSSSPETTSPDTTESTQPSVVDAAWERRDQLQTPRDDFGTVVVDDKVWVVGGMTGERGNKLATTEIYDPATDAWSMGPRMPTARSSLATATVNGVIYAFGGSGVDPTLDTAEALDTATGQWKRVAPIPLARYEHGAVVVDGKIWVIGGSEDTGVPRAVPTASVQIYDPATDTWAEGPPLGVARSSLRTVVMDGKIYAAGGFDVTNQPTPVVEVFDPAVGSWQVGPPLPESLFNFGFGAYEGELHAIYHEHHFVLDAAAGAWRVEPSPTISRHGLGMIELDGLLYAIGGCTEEPLADVNTVQVWQG